MVRKWLLKGVLISLLAGCSSKLADLGSPCPQFGRYCPQYSVNEDPMGDSQ